MGSDESHFNVGAATSTLCAAEPLLKLLFRCWLDETFVEFDLICRRKQQNIEKKKNNNIFIEDVGR